MSVLLVALLVGFVTEARAYTDPGTGVLLWQSLVAMLAGVGYYVRKRFWARRTRSGEQRD